MTFTPEEQAFWDRTFFIALEWQTTGVNDAAKWADQAIQWRRMSQSGNGKKSDILSAGA